MANNRAEPLISVIMPFFNTPPVFMQEAIESVQAQQYTHWELLLVDDGSDIEASRTLARRYAAASHQIRYLTHPDYQNLGVSASRQLGLLAAQGEYVAFLDADDLYLPHKLNEQVDLLQANPTAAMLYGMTCYWSSWTEEPGDWGRDFTPAPHIPADRLYEPPLLLPLFLGGKTAVPCMGSVLVQRHKLLQTGGFEPQFTGMYEDQVFYAKICLTAPIYVSTLCWDWYRQHPNSMTGLAERTGQTAKARRHYLNWLKSYLVQVNCHSPAVWQALQHEEWLLKSPKWLPTSIRPYLRWVKKWLLRASLMRTG